LLRGKDGRRKRGLGLSDFQRVRESNATLTLNRTTNNEAEGAKQRPQQHDRQSTHTTHTSPHTPHDFATHDPISTSAKAPNRPKKRPQRPHSTSEAEPGATENMPASKIKSTNAAHQKAAQRPLQGTRRRRCDRQVPQPTEPHSDRQRGLGDDSAIDRFPSPQSRTVTVNGDSATTARSTGSPVHRAAQ
jgi:hypothetical protein